MPYFRHTLAPLALLLCAALLSGQTKPIAVTGGGLTGPVSGLAYITANVPPPPPGFGYGVSFYNNAWPLLPSPLANFQLGLPSTWITPDNSTYARNGQLCLPGSYAYTVEQGSAVKNFSTLFQTIEGGMGKWVDTRFPYVTPKYKMNSIHECYTNPALEIATPGWSFHGNPLADKDMSLTQLSNRLLVAPDGMTLKAGTNNQFLGVAWMALPLTGYQPPVEYYYLQSVFQTPQNRCLSGNTSGSTSFSGGAYMATCDESQPVLWSLQPAGNGYYQLQTELSAASNLCLEGNTGKATAVHAGAPYMAACNGSSGQLWAFKAANSYYQLQTKLSQQTNQCLESNNPDTGSPANMNACGLFSGQLWGAGLQPNPGQPAVGNKSWTLFFNTTNFKGPVAFYQPDVYEEYGNLNPAAAGRGLDVLPAQAQGGAMEFNTIPLFLSQDTNGVVYSKVPRIQFPMDSNGASVLAQDATYYSPDALFSPAGVWFSGGAASAGTFDSNFVFKPANCGVNPFSFGQYLNSTDPTARVALTGIEQFVQTKLFDSANCRWGLQWTGRQVTTSDGMAVLPEYYQQNGNSRSAVPASAVPASTNLAGATFPAANVGAPLVNSGTPSWTSPGPVKGPFTAYLSDGSMVTYSWYRFVDQPSLQHLNLSAGAKAAPQQKVTQIHQNWPLDRDYMAPPSSGSLVSLDPALLVTPPVGLETGYVPVVTGQSKAAITGPAITSPTITSVVNAANGNSSIAPNTYISVNGVNLAAANISRIWQGSDFVNGQLPVALDGVSVTVNGKAAYVYFISPTQLNLLTPPDAISGSVAVQVTVNGAVSNTYNAAAQSLTPSFFTFGGSYIAATHADGSLLGPTGLYPGASSPAKPGETIILYGNGFGATSQAVVGGAPSQSGTLTPLPAIQIGGLAATVQFAGLISPGLFQLNVVVPSQAPDGNLTIRATANGSSTQSGALVAVQH